MAKKLDFKDFLTVDYAPGMPDLIKKRAKKRKMDSGGGTNAEYSSTISPEEDIDTIEESDLDELSMSVKDFQKTGLNKVVTKDKDKLKKDLEAMKARLNKEEVEEVDEALSLAQRRALSRRMKLKRKKIEVGRKRAMARAADPARLKKRADKAARNAIFKKLAKGKSRSELPPQRRAEIEKRMAKMGSRITRLATKLLPQVRKMDKERRMSKNEKK